MAFAQEDYARFRSMLRFFVAQAEKNARNGAAEQPAVYPDVDGDFCSHYGIEPTLFSYPDGLEYGVHFEFRKHFDTPNSTYLNVFNSWVAIEPQFAGEGTTRTVTALTGMLRSDAGFGGYRKDLDDSEVEAGVTEALATEHGGTAASVRRGEANAAKEETTLAEAVDEKLPESISFSVADLGLDDADDAAPSEALVCLIDQQADLVELHRTRKLARRHLEQRDVKPRDRARVAEDEAEAAAKDAGK
ncbi:hypothetical protein [Bifidobacterium choloepi]|uniref:Uncharacterized protein n=1 Tax=Bifidobacterium choloepi TaxID=2614131 RepID=A0A6I5N2N1_9BIFI|nr:hypothetical protein [Bifidobacterium choloepi]NEG70435.1 hypothetical protein [Bifidobacterium choloepi]